MQQLSSQHLFWDKFVPVNRRQYKHSRRKPQTQRNLIPVLIDSYFHLFFPKMVDVTYSGSARYQIQGMLKLFRAPTLKHSGTKQGREMQMLDRKLRNLTSIQIEVECVFFFFFSESVFTFDQRRAFRKLMLSQMKSIGRNQRDRGNLLNAELT